LNQAEEELLGHVLGGFAVAQAIESDAENELPVGLHERGESLRCPFPEVMFQKV